VVWELIVLGGPNGAGKTTAAQMVVPRKLHIAEFVNADEIARGLSPFNPEGAAFAAGRLMLERVRRLASGDSEFAIETTCSGKGHINFLHHCKQKGWQITLIFLWLPSFQMALERVANRVAAGGHSIPAEIVTRRYWAGLRNLFTDYLPLADVAPIYDYAGDAPILIVQRESRAELVVHDAERWKRMESTSRCPI
jgi:predicted ABC-type ATPase